MQAELELEARNRRVYKLVALVSLVVVLAIAIWLVFPPKRHDLRFLGALHPKKTRVGLPDVSLAFKTSPPTIERLLDSHLTRKEHWFKTGGSSYHVWNYGVNGKPEVIAEPLKGGGTILTLIDPRRTFVLPE